jgi:hypothetical protein
MMNFDLYAIIIGYKFFLCKNILVEVLSKLYVRYVKKIVTEPTRRFSHTSVSFTCSYHLQQGRTNPEYSIILRKTYPSGGKKRLQGYARLSDLWIIATAGSITKSASLNSIFISNHY